MEDPPPPEDKWALSPEAFERLLSWLHPDRDQAGLKYEEIRTTLIKRFRQKGCLDPEDLADKTINRVAGTLADIIDTYEGPPEPYVYKVAHFIFMEYLKRPIVEALAKLDVRDPSPGDEEKALRELLDSCLSDCLNQLDQQSREMILEYYRGKRQVKIKARNDLAKRLGISLPTLRLRAQRTRAKLKKCLLACMEQKAEESHILV